MRITRVVLRDADWELNIRPYRHGMAECRLSFCGGRKLCILPSHSNIYAIKSFPLKVLPSPLISYTGKPSVRAWGGYGAASVMLSIAGIAKLRQTSAHRIFLFQTFSTCPHSFFLSYLFAMATNSIKLLTGNSHPQLAKLVADRYDGLSPSIRI